MNALTHSSVLPGRLLVRAAGLAVALSAWAVHTASGQGFSQGNLVVVRVDGEVGGAPLNAAHTVTLVEFTTAGAPTGVTITLPFSSSGMNRMCTLSQSDRTEGHLNLSADAQYLTLAGYDAPPGLSHPSTYGAGLDRVVARVDAIGQVDTTTAISTTLGGMSVRSACSVDGTAFWIAGSAQKVVYAPFGPGSGGIVGTPGPTIIRAAGIFSGKLMVSSTSPGYSGVCSVGAGAPPVSATTVTLLPGMFNSSATWSPNEFFLADSSTLYVADDSDPSIGTGGLQKWTFDSMSGLWSLAYTLKTGLSFGLESLTGAVDGSGNVTLYATTARSVWGLLMNDLVFITDTGSSAAFTVLATAPGTTVYRGVAFAPTPSASPTGACCLSGGCQVTNAEGCWALGGTYHGNSTTCTGVNCAPVICYANCDQSTTPPILNVADFACFLNAFAGGGNAHFNPDCDESGEVNVLDFVCFLNRFAAGCS